MFANKQFRRAKTNRFKQNKKAIAEHYKKKRLLCDTCGLCRLSVEEIEKNYEKILARISANR